MKINRLLFSTILLAILHSTPLFAVKTIKDNLHSKAMDKEIPYVVVLPDSYETESDKTFPVLYCLHGANAPYDTWSVMAPLNEAIDGDYPTILVTFEAGLSSYLDFADDPSIRYTTFFFEELVPFIESSYRAGGKKELRAVTGFSMGGFGAFHYMLQRPDFFSSVSSLSGAFNRARGDRKQFNLYEILKAASEKETELPPLYLGCGVDDRLLEDSRKMSAELEKLGYTVTYVEGPGAHNWPYWRDASIDIIKFHYPHFSK